MILEKNMILFFISCQKCEIRQVTVEKHFKKGYDLFIKLHESGSEKVAANIKEGRKNDRAI